MITLIVHAGSHDEAALARTLSGFAIGAVEGVIGDAIVTAGGAHSSCAAIAEAAGAEFLADPSPAEVIGAARGDWLLIVDAGAEPLNGWIGPVAAWMAHGTGPARFTLVEPGRGLLAFLRRRPPMRAGFLMPKRLAAVAARRASSLEDIARGRTATRLAARLVPARS